MYWVSRVGYVKAEHMESMNASKKSSRDRQEATVLVDVRSI